MVQEERILQGCVHQVVGILRSFCLLPMRPYETSVRLEDLLKVRGLAGLSLSLQLLGLQVNSVETAVNAR